MDDNGFVFVSYSNKDIVHVEKLIETLKHEGFNPWVDKEGLKAGTPWRERLHAQVEDCDAYLIIISRNSEASEWVQEELDLAQSLNKPIFPLRIDNTKPFFGIRRIQYEDIRRGKMPTEAFYQRLAKVTSRKHRRKRSHTDRAKKQVVEGTTQLASYYWEELSNKGRDLITAASKKSSEALKSFANSEMVKRISPTAIKTELPEEKSDTPKRVSSTTKKASAPKKTSSTKKKASVPKKNRTTLKKTTTK